MNPANEPLAAMIYCALAMVPSHISQKVPSSSASTSRSNPCTQGLRRTHAKREEYWGLRLNQKAQRTVMVATAHLRRGQGELEQLHQGGTSNDNSRQRG